MCENGQAPTWTRCRQRPVSPGASRHTLRPLSRDRDASSTSRLVLGGGGKTVLSHRTAPRTRRSIQQVYPGGEARPILPVPRPFRRRIAPVEILYPPARSCLRRCSLPPVGIVVAHP